MIRPQLILASRSPRRVELLSRLGLEFLALPADIDEAGIDGETPSAHALRLASEKAAVIVDDRPVPRPVVSAAVAFGPATEAARKTPPRHARPR
jgi:predicted house-cleaning NTP pyrophosphatase (Maf/HAM1 superfamily)